MECNHFAEQRKDIFGGTDVVELFRFHPTLLLLYIKECQFHNALSISDKLLSHNSLHCVYNLVNL